MIRPSWLYYAVPVAALAFFLMSAVNTLQFRRAIKETNQGLNRFRTDRSWVNPGENNRRRDPGLEATLGRLSQSANLKRLLSVGMTETPSGNGVLVEWEGTLAGTLRFLNLLRSESAFGPCQKLQLASVGQGQGPLRGKASFILDSRITDAKISVSSSTISLVALKMDRDIFASPWPIVEQVSMAESETRRLKKEREGQQKEQDHMEKERLAQQEQEKLKEKRRHLEDSLAVTGIMNNGREALAFIQLRSGGGQNLMVRTGDTVEEARVLRIDEKKGEVELDYLGQFQIRLKLSSRSSGAIQ